MNRIYISYPGAVCAAGLNAKDIWNSAVSGNQSGIKKIKAVSGEEFFAARIDDRYMKKASGRFDMRIHRIQELALDQISDYVEKAKEKYGPERIAVCAGSCDNGTEFSTAGHRKFFSEGKFPDGYSLEIQGADYTATFISEKFRISGPSLAFSTACSSSACAIIKAAQLLKSGAADAVIAGGTDIASDTVLLGFNSLEAVSSGITNPFSRNRCGITLGEGAAFFLLTKEPQDKTGMELLGWGESSDAHHMTSPDPQGSGAEKAMREALDSAGLKPSEIDYINLHGTGTKLNDSMEALAVTGIFGKNTVPVSTTKPLTGHTLGAAAALEAAVCYMAVTENKDSVIKRLPVQVWDGIKDENIPEMNFIGIDSDFSNEIRICMSNSFAFGGSNASLILGIR